MDFLRSLIFIIVVTRRTNDILVSENIDEFNPIHLFTTASQHSILHGHHVFYQNFVTTFSIISTRSTQVSCITRSRNTAQVWLLLCGDIHPCPGPCHKVRDYHSSTTGVNFSEKRGLHFIHLNTRSLIPKLDELRLLANEHNPAVIFLSETWLDSSVPDSEINIPNYNVQRKDRLDGRGGGVCAYVRSDLAFNPRHDLDSPDLEATWVDILLPKTKPILCGVVYRPPTQLNFYSVFESLCHTCDDFITRETLIFGDFNTNVSGNKCSLLNSLSSLCELFNFTQLIKDPTRISNCSSTIIDLILVSDKDKISNSGVIDISLSDHSMIFCTRKITRSAIGKHNTIRLRSQKNYNRENFQQSLLSSDWSSVILSDNVSEAWCNFKNLFMSVLDNHAPVKQVRIKQRTEPWITDEILQSINARDKAFHLYKRNNTSDNFDSFKMHRAKAQSLIHNAKINYFKNSIESNKSDSKSLWKCLKQLGLPSKKGVSSSSNIGLKINGEISFDLLSVAEKFNSFYTSVALKLVEKLPGSYFKYGKSFVSKFYESRGIFPNSFSFSVVTENTILKHLNKLSANKATGLDGIPCRFLRDSATVIACPLTHIVNLSIIQGSVPEDLKIARVIPLYKKNDKTEVGNYRPVSILSIISKIFERVIYDQMEDYLNEKKILYNFQSGFRRGFSTDTCLIHLSDFVKFQMDKGNMVGMLLLDLQKAFDTVNHSILLMKLSAIGLTSDAVLWFQSYLCDRHQLVDVSGVHSGKASVTCGVPQGSILGPLLFLTYVNDMSDVVKHKLLLYADDSGILVHGKDIAGIESLLSDELEHVSEWLVDNKLSLHLGKTESILFGSKPKLRSQCILNISCNGSSIQATSSVKYLGVTLDQNLSCGEIARSIVTKANARLKYLYRKGHFLNLHTRKLLVMSLIQCHFDYVCSFWYPSLTQYWKNRLQTTQNKLVRFVLNMNSWSHVGVEQFKFLNWLPVSKRVDQITLCHVHRIKSGTAPEYLKEHFIPLAHVHNHSTRSRMSACPSSVSTDANFSFSDTGRFSLPKVGSFGKKSFVFNGIVLWNNIPQHLRDIESFPAFKTAIKTHLMDS